MEAVKDAAVIAVTAFSFKDALISTLDFDCVILFGCVMGNGLKNDSEDGFFSLFWVAEPSGKAVATEVDAIFFFALVCYACDVLAPDLCRMQLHSSEKESSFEITCIRFHVSEMNTLWKKVVSYIEIFKYFLYFHY